VRGAAKVDGVYGEEDQAARAAAADDHVVFLDTGGFASDGGIAELVEIRVTVIVRSKIDPGEA